MSISIEQVSKHYGEGPAVSDVSVDIADGELFVLLGPSGSGKSTLLRAIAGLTDIDRGRIVLHGRDVTQVSAREREVGFVFQNYALFRHMSVADNIEFALRARRVGVEQRRRRRRELLELVALEGYDGRYPAELSGGQQQRVAVARALAHEPGVLLLDEPFGALDARIRDELRRSIRRIQRTVGITTILVTHDQEEAFGMADRIGLMDRGRLQEVGEPRALYRRPATRFAASFLGSANILVGRHERESVRLGLGSFTVEHDGHAPADGDEIALVVRPEDVVLAPHPELLSAPAAGTAVVSAIEFVGSVERLRLEVPADEPLAGALAPVTGRLPLEASRTAREIESFPLSPGQRVWFGFEVLHALPTSISSIRLHALSGPDAERLSRAPLLRELGERLRIEPTRHADPLPEAENLCGLPVVELGEGAALERPLELLGRGARQVLAVRADGASPRRMIIHVDADSGACDEVLRAAASLARHLTVEVTMLVGDGRRSPSTIRFRELLDLRNASLARHGLDIRTEFFAGPLAAALRARARAGDGATLLVLGLGATPGSDEPFDGCGELLRDVPPTAVLLVVGRDRSRSLAVHPVPAARASAGPLFPQEEYHDAHPFPPARHIDPARHVAARRLR